MWDKVKQSRVFWTVLFVLVAFIWGVAFVVVKDAVDDITPMYLVSSRFAVSFVAGILICYFRKTPVNSDVMKKGVYLGIALFVAYALQTYGIIYTTAGKNAFITAFYIVLVPFFNLMFFGRKVTVMQVVGAFIALFGVGLLTLGGDAGINLGDILTFLCAIAFAVQIVLTGRFSPGTDGFCLNTVQLGTVTLLSLIMAPVMDGSPSSAIRFSGGVIFAILYLGVLSTFFAECVQTIGLRYINPLLATILMSLESVFGVAASVLLLGEKMTVKMIFGCILMFVAILIVEKESAKTEE